MTPTIGRIVHYQTYGTPDGEHPSAPVAAIITAVHSERFVSLCAFYPNGMSFKDVIRVSDVPKPGHWNWPPRSES